MAIVCVPGSAPSSPHSMPQAVTAGQARHSWSASNGFPWCNRNSDAVVQPRWADRSRFTAIGKTLTSQRPVDDSGVFTGTPFILTGTFKGTTFVDVRVDGRSIGEHPSRCGVALCAIADRPRCTWVTCLAAACYNRDDYLLSPDNIDQFLTVTAR